MRARLQGGRFRWLNEALYTSDGATALTMVQKEPELMEQYHEGKPALWWPGVVGQNRWAGLVGPAGESGGAWQP